MRTRNLLARLAVAVMFLGGCGAGGDESAPDQNGSGAARTTSGNAATDVAATIGYPVVSVADGDTITVDIDGASERIRLIGIDAPELRPAECYGRESAERVAALVTGAGVQLIADPSQDDRDRYGRLLRYVVLADGTMVNRVLIRDGLAREYTYAAPYLHQQEFRAEQDVARDAGTGVWSMECQQQLTAPATTSPAAAAPDPGCPIKGNVNSNGDRIYHVPGDDSYDETVISPAKGEQWFCRAADAEAAGWRAAKN